MELINFEFIGLGWGHPSCRGDSLAKLQEVYEAAAPVILQDSNISPHTFDVESEQGEKSLLSVTLATSSTLPLTPLLASGGTPSSW